MKFLFVLPVVLGLQCSPALSHSWYEAQCCNGSDCRPVSQEDLEEVGNGCWVYKPNGIKFCGSRVRPSHDSQWHVCYNHVNLTPYCVYVQTGF